ncbi:hypothetical protein [Ancylobacter defluvii]|uniref:Uncharacterized protein n=1 Tax=Ancylobacter defluvii TaxID=1282440 RepID=A0A9W6K0G4_9HYPH|nr:hypothetical protein [Ancylobacter defluvii]MBS7586443.1 hypothetical protein [Ancylobacter defluvii]GLK85724.1 hypothetical protein GCM10017653_37940 [Ancylobacter defluvii]
MPPRLPHIPTGPRRDDADRAPVLLAVAVLLLSLTIGFWLGVIFHAAIL